MASKKIDEGRALQELRALLGLPPSDTTDPRVFEPPPLAKNAPTHPGKDYSYSF